MQDLQHQLIVQLDNTKTQLILSLVSLAPLGTIVKLEALLKLNVQQVIIAQQIVNFQPLAQLQSPVIIIHWKVNLHYLLVFWSHRTYML